MDVCARRELESKRIKRKQTIQFRGLQLGPRFRASLAINRGKNRPSLTAAAIAIWLRKLEKKLTKERALHFGASEWKTAFCGVPKLEFANVDLINAANPPKTANSWSSGFAWVIWKSNWAKFINKKKSGFLKTSPMWRCKKVKATFFFPAVRMHFTPSLWLLQNRYKQNWHFGENSGQQIENRGRTSHCFLKIIVFVPHYVASLCAHSTEHPRTIKFGSSQRIQMMHK